MPCDRCWGDESVPAVGLWGRPGGAVTSADRVRAAPVNTPVLHQRSNPGQVDNVCDVGIRRRRWSTPVARAMTRLTATGANTCMGQAGCRTGAPHARDHFFSFGDPFKRSGRHCHRRPTRRAARSSQRRCTRLDLDAWRRPLHRREYPAPDRADDAAPRSPGPPRGLQPVVRWGGQHPVRRGDEVGNRRCPPQRPRRSRCVACVAAVPAGPAGPPGRRRSSPPRTSMGGGHAESRVCDRGRSGRARVGRDPRGRSCAPPRDDARRRCASRRRARPATTRTRHLLGRPSWA